MVHRSRFFTFLQPPPRASRSRQGDHAATRARPLSDPTATDLVAKSVRPSRRTSATAFTAAPPQADDPLLAFAPYLHPRPRRNSITPARQRAFISTLAATGIVTQAARSIGVSLEALYKLRRLAGAEGFAAAWEAALDHGVARLEDCALALALEGEEVPIVSGGAILGWHKRRNVSLIQFLLRQRRSGRFAAGLRDAGELGPGHRAYDKLRAEWQAEHDAGRERRYPAWKAEFDRHILAMRARMWDDWEARQARRKEPLEPPDGPPEIPFHVSLPP